MFSESQASILEVIVTQANSKRAAGGNAVEVDDALKQVHFLLHDHMKLLEASLELLDHERRKSVQMIEDEHGERCFWRVQGSREQDYLCLSHHCSCPSFQQLLRNSSDGQQHVMCKHLLAIKLAQILGLEERSKLPLDQFMERMCQAVELSSAAPTASTGTFHHYHSHQQQSPHQSNSFAPTFRPH